MGSFVSLRSHASVIVRVLGCKRVCATDSGSVIYYICATQCPNDVVPKVDEADFCFKYHAAQDEVEKMDNLKSGDYVCLHGYIQGSVPIDAASSASGFRYLINWVALSVLD